MSYGVAQKVLLRRLASQQILFLLYTLCTLALLPLAKPGVITQLSDWQLACLIFCGLNTLVGYGALAEAMARHGFSQRAITDQRIQPTKNEARQLPVAELGNYTRLR